ncbi:MAG: hypothetical protein ACREHD_33080, partial [Pirellulales bacterium]
AIQVPQATVKPNDGKVHLAVRLTLPEGYKINPQAPMAYRLESSAKSGAVNRRALGKSIKLEEPATDVDIDVPLSTDSGSDELKLTLTYYYCQEGGAGLCKVGAAAWKIPIKLAADADTSTVPLELEVK